MTNSVAAGTCSRNFETQPTGQTTRPPELLALVLNVPNLTLHGAGVMKYADVVVPQRGLFALRAHPFGVGLRPIKLAAPICRTGILSVRGSNRTRLICGAA
jgi:hypothetical protein